MSPQCSVQEEQPAPEPPSAESVQESAEEDSSSDPAPDTAATQSPAPVQPTPLDNIATVQSSSPDTSLQDESLVRRTSSRKAALKAKDKIQQMAAILNKRPTMSRLSRKKEVGEIYIFYSSAFLGM
jgi:hypothetical protein